MRIVSWNCNMGFAKKREVVMDLRPDIVILQECSFKDIERTEAPFKHWVGFNKHKGLAIIGFADHEYHIDGSYAEEWPWFIPLRIDDVPLHIVGIWACVINQRMRYVRVTHKAVDHYATFLSLQNAMIIGDFNSNTIWDTNHRQLSHSKLVEKLDGIGLVSVYHTLRGEIQGKELTPTQFMYRNISKPYHLDFVFVSKTLSCSCELSIGEPSEWISRSDHMPLILTVSV
ncbi:MAG TPA: endonuclease/exonuclease/phosphatase family protein [Ktedonosporobacter sp.]|nr:endonuclease/exonuclease/phosphatase family protein [Ktedonosporobacter sp.]